MIEGNSTVLNQSIQNVNNGDIAIIPSRCEMIIPIQITDDRIKENDTLIIYSQAVQDLVQCGNVISTVKDQQILIKIVNQNEKSIKLQAVDLNNLLYEQYEETSLKVCTKLPEVQEKGDRLQLLEKSLRLQHLNKEEYRSLKDIFTEYSDVFLLEGDKLEGTAAIQHRIKTSPDIQPVYIKPYRLPQNHKQEISMQVDQMEKDGIIT